MQCQADYHAGQESGVCIMKTFWKDMKEFGFYASEKEPLEFPELGQCGQSDLFP